LPAPQAAENVDNVAADPNTDAANAAMLEAAATSEAAAELGPADAQFSPPDDVMAYYRTLMSLPPCQGETQAAAAAAHGSLSLLAASHIARG
jgi:hypothetical protein